MGGKPGRVIRSGWRWPDVKPCGTEAACRRHYRHGEKPCEDCRRGRSRYREDLSSRETREILEDLETMLAIAEGTEDGSLAEDDGGTWHRKVSA
jgi:hypothetical protein